MDGISRYPSRRRKAGWGSSEYTLKSRGEYERELQVLVRHHPEAQKRIVENEYSSHRLMTGGKFLFNAEAVPEQVLEALGTQPFTGNYRAFVRAAPDLLGHEATYEELFWLSWAEYLAGSLAEPPTVRRNICMTEVPSHPCFHFFVDLDIIFTTEHTQDAYWKDFLKRVCKIIGSSVAACFPSILQAGDPEGLLHFTVLLTQGYRPKDERTAKRGVHLVWSKLHVDVDMAQTLCRLMDEQLTQQLPRDTHLGENPWSEAIDLSVYHSGLRMVGTPKSSKCPQCYRRTQDRVAGRRGDILRESESVMCHRGSYGYIFGGKETIYLVSYVARANGSLEPKTRLKDKMQAYRFSHGDHVFDLSWKFLTSIRSTALESTEGFVRPAHIRGNVLSDQAIVGHSYRVKSREDEETAGAGSGKRKRETAAQDPFRGGVALYVSPEQLAAVTRMVREYHSVYTSILIDRMRGFPYKPGAKQQTVAGSTLPSLYRFLWICLKGPGSCFCFQKGREHTTNTALMQIYPDGRILQTCWSVKPGPDGVRCCDRGRKAKGNRVSDVYHPLLQHLFTLQA